MNRLYLALIGTLLFCAGCPASPPAFCEGMIEAECVRFQRCSPGLFGLAFSSVDDCIITGRDFTVCSDDTAEDWCSNPEDYHPGAAGACLRETRNGECGADTPSCDLVCGG